MNSHGLIHVKSHNSSSSFIFKFYFIRKMFHDKNAPSSRFVDMFRGSGVFQGLKIKTLALIFNNKSNLVFQKPKFYIYHFSFISLVAVDNGISYTFGDRNLDVPIDVVVNVEFFPGIINEALNDPDIFYQ